MRAMRIASGSLLICSLLLLSACRGEAPIEPSGVGLDPMGEGDLLPEAQAQPMERQRRRMDLDQLRASILQVTDGVGWTEDRNGNEVDLFVELSSTLGKPDYAENTNEDLTASPLFQKFLADAANSVCVRTVQRDLTRPANTRVVLRHVEPYDRMDSAPEAVKRNASALLRRFHGRNYTPDSEQLNPWTFLFETATHVSDDPVKGWEAVCVALLSHPDFYSY